MSSKPKLIIINGLPATGKTWLANEISNSLGLPQITKDQLKVEILKQLGTKDRSWDIQIGITSIKLQMLMAREFLGKNISLIIESNYKQDYDAPLILDLIKNVSCDCLQIICQARGDLLAERYTQRILKSERPHELNTPGIIEEFQTKLLHATEPPLKIPGRQILVDTNDFSTVDLKSIISEVQVFLN